MKIKIPAVDKVAEDACRNRWNSIAKPIGSLGLLEEYIIKIAALTGREDISIDKRAVCVFCADNGVVRQGVSSAGSDVTLIMARGLLNGDTAVCHMAKAAKADVFPVDVGMNEIVEGIPALKTKNGTGDISLEPAMAHEEVHYAVNAGVEMAFKLADMGYNLVAAGELGMGNTTTSCAVASVLLGKDPSAITGGGAGLDSVGLRNKIDVIKRAIVCNKPDPSDALDVLGKVGGFDIAAMAGFYIGCAARRVPVVLDGLISCTAALAAKRLCPGAENAMIGGHLSAEPAAKHILEELNISPIITAQMRLGEGTGAVAAIPVLDLANAVYHDMCTFGEMAIISYKPPQ